MGLGPIFKRPHRPALAAGAATATELHIPLGYTHTGRQRQRVMQVNGDVPKWGGGAILKRHNAFQRTLPLPLTLLLLLPLPLGVGIASKLAKTGKTNGQFKTTKPCLGNPDADINTH